MRRMVLVAAFWFVAAVLWHGGERVGGFLAALCGGLVAVPKGELR